MSSIQRQARRPGPGPWAAVAMAAVGRRRRAGRVVDVQELRAARCQRRDELKAHLAAKEIGTEIYYPVSLHEQECFGYLGYRASDFSNARKATQETLALPVYAELSPEQRSYVVSSIAEFYLK